MNYLIKKLSDLEDKHLDEVSIIFMEGFGHQFESFTRDKEALRKVFKTWFVPSTFYVCLDDNTVIGFLSLATNRDRSIEVDSKIVKNIFGKVKGGIFAYQAKLIMTKINVKKSNECYIDFIATKKEYRCKGIASALFDFIHKIDEFNGYWIEVLSNNSNAKALYEKLGYNTIKVKFNLFTRLGGFGDIVQMKYLK